jgi:ABC-type branched-subunit amino acid transport system ATPase component/ABC-type branched-subunit amino acid transport system permease subunit
MSKYLAERKTAIAIAAFIVMVGIYPLIFSNSYEIGIGITAGALAAGAVGFVLLLGYAHQLAVGQAGFCMVGGYSSAILCVNYGWDPFLALLFGVALSMIIAYPIAAPILRLRGFVLVMGSLAFQLILVVVAFEMEFTGGALGTYGVPRFAILGWTLPSDHIYFYFVWACVLATIAIGLNIDRSRIGRALKAIAISETTAGSVGIDTIKYKVQMFVISAGMASISGSLFVHFLRAMDPTVFGFAFSLNLVIAVIIGGLMSIWGGAVGATIVTGLREGLRGLSLPLWEAVIMGGLTVFVLIAFQRGVAGNLSVWFDRVTGRRGTGTPTIVEPAGTPIPGVEIEPGKTILEVNNVTKLFGSLRAVDDVSFTVEAGSITALIGPNGAGKTTLFNLIGGYQPLNQGTILYNKRPIHELIPNEIAELGIGRTFQNLQLFDNMTVLENVMCGRHRLHAAGIAQISAGLPQARRDEENAVDAARRCLEFVGLRGADDLSAAELSFGHMRLVEIARALALEPEMLLMDEPASGLNDTETEQLAELILEISAVGITVLLVEHDMRLVMGLADKVVVMHHGQKIADGPPDQVRRSDEVIAAYLGTEKHEAIA